MSKEVKYLCTYEDSYSREDYGTTSTVRYKTYDECASEEEMLAWYRNANSRFSGKEKVRIYKVTPIEIETKLEIKVK